MSFISFASYFVERRTDLKNQKMVGQVVKHVEGDEHGLVHVRVRGIHDDWPDEALPKMQMKQGYGSGAKDGTTNPTEQIPPVGSKIFCQFEDNSHYHGQYFGGSATDDKKSPEFTGQENYGKTYGHADVGGNLDKVRTEEGKEDITRQHVSGTSHNMDKDGNYNIKASKALNFEGSDGGTIKVKGKLVFEADQIEFKHKGATTSMPINLGAGGPSAPTKPTKRSRPSFGKPGSKV